MKLYRYDAGKKQTPIEIQEAVVAEPEKIVEARPQSDEDPIIDQEAMRQFAHQQLASSHPHVNKKIRHYD